LTRAQSRECGRAVVLNVDDSEERLRYRTTVLRAAGFDVLEARTGAAALDVVEQEHPSVILLDVNLPDMNGFEVCARLKARGASTSQIPVLHVSAALCEDQHWVLGLRVGAEGYLREPVGDDVLTEVILATLARAEEAAIAASARRDAHEALRISVRRYRELIEHAPYGICQTTSDGRLVVANQALAYILGYGAGAAPLAGESLASCFVAPSEWTRLIARLNADTAVRNVELTWRRKDDQQIRVSVSGQPVPEGYELFVEDITERQSVEAQLRQAHKLEALGLLAGGVAHDFNNALTVILGFTDMLTSQIGIDKPIGRDLAEIRRAATHASDLTRQLLAFSKEQPLLLTIVDLNAVVADATGMITCLLGETIHVDVARPSGVCLVNADRAQLEQVLVNLAANARDAMPTGGTLTIETAGIAVDQRFALSNPPLEPGRYVRLTVRDTGSGMPDEIKHRIFDPFFTTKAVGQGTGLGLSTVYGVTKQLRGFVLVESEMGEGTRFDLYFPESTGMLPARDEQVTYEVPTRAAGILVVEDEPAVRALTVTVLTRHGYRVVQAADASEVSRLADAVLERVDLVLTDMVMPVLSGRTLAKRLVARHPHLRVLYMSGYPGRRDAESSVLDGAVLRKPFTAGELLHAVKAALGSAEGAGEAVHETS
jgi:two-component system, cell cycle sensor histidine kinase and response regulator CckA